MPTQINLDGVVPRGELALTREDGVDYRSVIRRLSGFTVVPSYAKVLGSPGTELRKRGNHPASVAPMVLLEVSLNLDDLYRINGKNVPLEWKLTGERGPAWVRAELLYRAGFLPNGSWFNIDRVSEWGTRSNLSFAIVCAVVVACMVGVAVFAWVR